MPCGVTTMVMRQPALVAGINAKYGWTVAVAASIPLQRRVVGQFFNALISRKYKSRSHNKLHRDVALVKSFPLMCYINISDE